MIRFSLAFCLSFVTSNVTFASGSVIGNGGDPIFYFLESTRFSLIESIRAALTIQSEVDSFCVTPSLSNEQVLFCKNVFTSISSQILSMNSGTAKTNFVLREDPLLVLGPDGKPMPVAAKTILGPAGEIEFHRDSVKLLSPAQILFLIAHEFIHKSDYKGLYINDNDPIGSFAIGRDLIDSIASSLVEVAKRRGKIGSQYGLRDSFDCKVVTNGSTLGIVSSSPRLFLNETLMTYETSISNNPTDPYLYVPETTTANLVFRMQISEPANCSDDVKYDSTRQTLLSIVRQFKQVGNTTPQEQTLASDIKLAFNPICDKEHKDFGISFDGTIFSCKYYGTDGTTSSVLRVPKR